MIKKFAITITLVVEREIGPDETQEAIMDAIADDLTQTLSEYEVGTASVFPLPDDPPAPEPQDAAIIPFPGKRKI